MVMENRIYDRKKILKVVRLNIDLEDSKYYADKRRGDGPTSINGNTMRFWVLNKINQLDVDSLNDELNDLDLGVTSYIKGNLEEGFALWIRKKQSKEEDIHKND